MVSVKEFPPTVVQLDGEVISPVALLSQRYSTGSAKVPSLVKVPSNTAALLAQTVPGAVIVTSGVQEKGTICPSFINILSSS
jgi:hypothetical protein